MFQLDTLSRLQYFLLILTTPINEQNRRTQTPLTLQCGALQYVFIPYLPISSHSDNVDTPLFQTLSVITEL